MEISIKIDFSKCKCDSKKWEEIQERINRMDVKELGVFSSLSSSNLTAHALAWTFFPTNKFKEESGICNEGKQPLKNSKRLGNSMESLANLMALQRIIKICNTLPKKRKTNE